MTETKPRYSTVDQTIFDSLLDVMTPEQILSMVEELKAVKKLGHGEVMLVVKNGEIYFIDRRQSRDVRRPELKLKDSLNVSDVEN